MTDTQTENAPPRTGDILRWRVWVSYNTETMPAIYTFDLEELADLGEVIERGPHWDTIVDIRIVRIIEPAEVLTLGPRRPFSHDRQRHRSRGASEMNEASKIAYQQVDDLLDQIARLTDKVAQLEYQASRLVMGLGARNERAAILAYLRDETQIMAATVQAQNTLLEAAAKIEAGRHLK
jgi:hypothetical protein